jgi:hypothetical protein
MTEVSVTTGSLKKHSMGDLVLITADLTSVGNAETFTVPHLKKILHASFTCTTDDDSGMTYADNVITFANGASIAGSIAVMGW